MKVKPLGDKLLVRRAEAQSQTDAGIYLPESAKDKPAEGEIIATGSGILNKETGDRLPFTVKTGDRVIFTSYAGAEVKIDGDTLLIMTEEDILGIID
jgi:chaperonin GroES